MKLTEEQKKAALAGIEAGKKAVVDGRKKNLSWWRILIYAGIAAVGSAIGALSQGCANMPSMTLTDPDGGSITIHGSRPVQVQKGK